MNSIVKNREKLQNTKKIKDIVRKFSIISLSLILLLFSFSFSFADSKYTLPNSVTLMASDNGYGIFANTNYSDVFCFAYYSGTNFSLCFASELTGRTAYYGQYATSNPNTNNTANLNTLDSNTNLYYGISSGYSPNYFNNTNPDLPVFNTLETGLASLVAPAERYPYTFQNGYLFVYDLGNSGAMYSFDLTSKSEEYSNLGDYPFPDTNQSFWFSNSLPEIDETTIPDSNAIVIHWLKGPKQNIFGQTQDMIATISGTSSGRYLYIYNPPAHYKWVGNSNPTASETINYPVTINGVSSGDNFYIYDSIARLADYNQGGKVQGIVGEVGYGSVASDGAITVTTSDGAIYNQVSGGSTDISGANGGSIAENINGLKQTLDDFVNQFIQILSAPISHIQQLIQSSHQFFDVFSQLFEWLPSELSSVIVSGLIIMVVIGVIKMLL